MSECCGNHQYKHWSKGNNWVDTVLVEHSKRFLAGFGVARAGSSYNPLFWWSPTANSVRMEERGNVHVVLPDHHSVASVHITGLPECAISSVRSHNHVSVLSKSHRCQSLKHWRDWLSHESLRVLVTIHIILAHHLSFDMCSSRIIDAWGEAVVFVETTVLCASKT